MHQDVCKIIWRIMSTLYNAIYHITMYRIFKEIMKIWIRAGIPNNPMVPLCTYKDWNIKQSWDYIAWPQGLILPDHQCPCYWNCEVTIFIFSLTLLKTPIIFSNNYSLPFWKCSTWLYGICNHDQCIAICLIHNTFTRKGNVLSQPVSHRVPVRLPTKQNRLALLNFFETCHSWAFTSLNFSILQPTSVIVNVFGSALTHTWNANTLRLSTRYVLQLEY